MKDWPGDLGRIKILEEEIEYLKTLLRPHDTGHLHTTIHVLQRRVKQLKGDIDKI